MNTSENHNSIFPKGERTSPDYFTGTAWLNTLVSKDETGNFAVGSVTFEPGGKNSFEYGIAQTGQTHTNSDLALAGRARGECPAGIRVAAGREA